MSPTKISFVDTENNYPSSFHFSCLCVLLSLTLTSVVRSFDFAGSRRPYLLNLKKITPFSCLLRSIPLSRAVPSAVFAFVFVVVAHLPYYES